MSPAVTPPFAGTMVFMTSVLDPGSFLVRTGVPRGPLEESPRTTPPQGVRALPSLRRLAKLGVDLPGEVDVYYGDDGRWHSTPHPNIRVVTPRNAVNLASILPQLHECVHVGALPVAYAAQMAGWVTEQVDLANEAQVNGLLLTALLHARRASRSLQVLDDPTCAPILPSARLVLTGLVEDLESSITDRVTSPMFQDDVLFMMGLTAFTMPFCEFSRFVPDVAECSRAASVLAEFYDIAWARRRSDPLESLESFAAWSSGCLVSDFTEFVNSMDIAKVAAGQLLSQIPVDEVFIHRQDGDTVFDMFERGWRAQARIIVSQVVTAATAAWLDAASRKEEVVILADPLHCPTWFAGVPGRLADQLTVALVPYVKLAAVPYVVGVFTQRMRTAYRSGSRVLVEKDLAPVPPGVVDRQVLEVAYRLWKVSDSDAPLGSLPVALNAALDTLTQGVE